MLRNVYTEFEEEPRHQSVVLDMAYLVRSMLSGFYTSISECEVERKPSRKLILSYWDPVQCIILFCTVHKFAGRSMRLLLVRYSTVQLSTGQYNRVQYCSHAEYEYGTELLDWLNCSSGILQYFVQCSVPRLICERK